MLFHPDQIPDEAVDALRPAYEHGTKLLGTPELWVQRCRDDTAQLWVNEAKTYWAVTEVYEDSAYGKLFHAIASAGEYDQSLIEEGERWARDIGCKAAMTGGRRGWEKLFQPMGYKTISIVLLKEF